ncbi:MAG: serine/threonine-protein phosphatase [Prevotella sp.]|nr:serine/threonine-protein phosphatase [Prevotella sp.]
MEIQKIYTDDNKIITAFAESRIGGRPENQDSYGWSDTRHGYLVTVCDGMGGGPGGKTASTIAVKEIITTVAESDTDEEPANILIKAVRRANLTIIETASHNSALKGMGSTATVLLINEHAAYVAHVGDSRIYQIRKGQKVFRTFDHSLVFEMVAQGVITEEQARLSAQSNVITRALGIKQNIDVEVHELPYRKGDRFMLCSDGIHGIMPEKELLKMLAGRHQQPAAIVDNIATFVDNTGFSEGGKHDNLTLAIVETTINSQLKPKMTMRQKIILAALSVIALASISINVVQCQRTGGEVKDSKVSDIEKVLKDGKYKDSTYSALSDTLNKIINK